MSTPTPAERPRKRQRVDATRFLDLEATIDYNADADDEEVAASEDGFINDEEEDDAQEHTQHIQLERQLLIENNREHKGLEGESAVDAPDKPLPDLSGHFNLMDDLYAHIRRHKHQTTSAASILASGSFEGAEGHPAGQLEAWGVPVGSNWDVYNELESRLPRREDMLFEIPCKRGYKDAAVLSIMFLADAPISPPSGRLPPVAAAFSNPYLPGRIFLEVKMYSEAVAVARRVSHLKPVDIIEIEHLDRLRPLQLSPRTALKHNSWVRIERPAPLRGRIGLIIKTERSPGKVIVIPKGRNSNNDGLFIDAIRSTHPTEQDLLSTDLGGQTSDEAVLRYSLVKVGSRIYCSAGFRYIPVEKSILVNGDEILPPADKLSVFLKMRKISKTFYNVTLHRIQNQSLKEGDRLLLTCPDLAGLVGVFVTGDATVCRVYIPSMDVYVDEVSFDDICRHFRVGDRVRTADPRHGIDGVPLWIVALEGDQADVVNLADESEHRANVRHLTFCDSDNLPLSISLPPRKSRVRKHKFYTITFSQPLTTSDSRPSQNRIRHLHGRITDVASFDTAVGMLEFTTDLTFSPAISSLLLSVGLQVELRDEYDLGGTAFILAWTDTCLTLINLSPDFELLLNPASSGLYDRHVGKWVFVIAGVYKGTRGLIKAMTADGRATVELQVLPVRREIIHVTQLTTMKSDAMYGLRLGQRLVPAPDLPLPPSTSPWAAIAPPPPARPVTPPPPPSDYNLFPMTAERDCAWLGSADLEGIPIKLFPRKGMAPSSSAYRFLRVERQPVDEVSGLEDFRVWFTDRARERSLLMSEICWVVCTGSGQTVIMTDGENRRQLYWTLGAVGDEMMCRLEPKVVNEPSVLLPTSRLAQVFKPKR